MAKGHFKQHFIGFGMRLACALLALLLLPVYAREESEILEKVRVGIVEQEGYAQFDEDGVVRGRDAEYLARIAQYALLDLDYSVYDSFTELLDALERGEVDIVPGVSRNEDRELRMLFSERELASGYVTVKVYSDDESYEYGDLVKIQGMSIGYLRGGSEGMTFGEWAKDAGLEVQLTAFASTKELHDAIVTGKIDGVVSADNLMNDCRTILSIKSQSYYVAINQNRADLKLRIDSAMNRILEEMPMYTANLFYNQETRRQRASIVLTGEQKEYLQAHTAHPVRIAVLANDPPFSMMENGDCHGIVRDYYDQTAALLNEIVPGFSVQYVNYPTFDDAVKAVTEGDADLLGMVRLGAVEASRDHLLLTSSLQSINVMRLSLSSNLTPESAGNRAVVLTGDLETVRFVIGQDRDSYEWQTADTLEEARQKLELGEADMILLSLPHATWFVNQNRSGSFYLMTLPYAGWELSGAVNQWNAELGVILSKVARSDRVNISAIISENTVTADGLMTYLQRLPMLYYIVFFSLITGIFLLMIYLVMRTRHLRIQQRHTESLVQSQKELLHAYEYDALTGLANRNTAIRRANASLQSGEEYSMVLLTVNNLGIVNETFGYEQGDRVIKDLSARLLEFVRLDPERRFVCRYSGDEFLFLLRGVGHPETKNISEALRRIGTESILLSGDGTSAAGISIWPHISMGIAESDGISGPEQVIQNCAMAANAAREEGTGTIRVYAEQLKSELSRYNYVRDELIHAIENDAFTMVYQPKVDLKTGRMIGSEALVRIQGNKLSPGEFIPVAESSGYIQRVGRMTTRLVVRQLAQWREKGLTVYPVSINYSSNQLGDTGYVDYLLKLLEEYNVPASLIEIEVTEGLLMKRDSASEELFWKLKEAGFRLLLDDFGTGYSSIQYLSFIPVDVIKIDKSIIDNFLTDVPDEEGTNTFVQDLIGLLHDLGKEIVMEGVEEPWQVNKLRSYGCDVIQGYYFSRPLPPEKLAEYTLEEAQRQTLGL